MGQDSALALAAANKRIGNILRKSDESISENIDDSLLLLDEERQLFEEVIKAEAALKPALKTADYASCLDRLAGLRPAVDRFFDGVMVMDEDAAQRRNRLALLARLKGLFDSIADVSVLA
jgi:glycyl-tRNA synthetase beta chain